MLYKVGANGQLILLEFASEAEEYEFLQLNALLGYKKINKDELPEFRFKECLKWDSEQQKIVVDTECELEKLKQQLIQQINRAAEEYITKKLRELDWGKTYAEIISELNNSKEYVEGTLYALVKPYKPDITPDYIKRKVIEYLIGAYTKEDAIKELNQLNIPENKQKTILSVLVDAANIAQLIKWTNDVWNYVEQKEKEIKVAADFDSLKLLDARTIERLKEAKETVEGIRFDLEVDVPLPKAL